MTTSRGGLPRLSAQEEEAIRHRQSSRDLVVKPTLSSSSPTSTVPLSKDAGVAQLVPVGVSSETEASGRPKTPLDESDRLDLAGIASLAAAIMRTLRTPGRGRYDSELQLREWLSEDGVSYTTADLGPALDLLASTKRLKRPAVKPNASQPGWLATGAEIWSEMVPEEAEEAADEQHRHALAKPVLQVMEVGDARSGNRWTVEELSERLTGSGVSHSAGDLAQALSRLEDSGHLMRAQRQPYSVHPQHLVRKSIRPYDKYDVLAADVCAVLKRRHERFESEDQLQSWLDEDKVDWKPDDLATALDHLERIGRLRRPRADQRRSDSTLAAIYVPPRIFNE
jgi:hypothetical protein